MFLTNTASTRTGATNINAGILNVAKLADGAANSSIGAATATAGQLQFGGGTLQYTGSTAQSTNRLFTLNTGGGTIDASGSVSAATVNFTGTGALDGGTGATLRSLTLTGSNAGNNSLAGILADGTGSAVSLVKSGNGTWAVSGTNTYTGTTTISAGTLLINGNQPLATGAVSVASNATLGGNGTVGGATTFTGTSIHSAGSAAATVGTQNFSSSLTYGNGTIFAWDLDTLTGGDVTDPGLGVSDAATGTYDQVAAAGAITGGSAIFKILLATGDSFADAFWNTDKSWTNIFAGGSGSAPNLAALFSGFDTSGGVSPTGLVTDRGQFTLSTTTNTLNWSAVPEPTTALAGLLLGAGLLRRLRSA